jgi:hypothetical protein
MKVKFVQDYRGVLSAERFFSEGAVIDLEDEVNEGIDGDALIDEGRAKKSGSPPDPMAKKGAKGKAKGKAKNA